MRIKLFFSEKDRKKILTKESKYDRTWEIVFEIKKPVSEIEDVKTYMDIRPIANELINKYYKTRVDNKQLVCTRTKLGKLLTIIQIRYFKIKGDFAFQDNIVLDICGACIPALSILKYPYNIFGDKGFENDSRIDPNTIQSDNIEIPQQYNLSNNQDIPETLKTIIDNTFIEFGSYKSTTLGELITDLKDTIFKEGLLDKSKLQNWLQTGSTDNNAIAKFIFKA